MLPEKGIVEYVNMMKDCKEDLLYTVFEYSSFNHFPQKISVALTMKAVLKSSPKISNNVTILSI
jgi:hypothetical protein